MKKYIIFLFAFALSITVSNAQKNDGIAEKTSVKVDQKVKRNTLAIEQTDVTYPLILEREDRYKVNQDRILAQPEITKVIMVDKDQDLLYDRMIKLNYEKPKHTSLEFVLTENGLTITSEDAEVKVKQIRKSTSNVPVDIIQDEGSYIVSFTDGHNAEIQVENYWMSK